MEIEKPTQLTHLKNPGNGGGTDPSLAPPVGSNPPPVGPPSVGPPSVTPTTTTTTLRTTTTTRNATG